MKIPDAKAAVDKEWCKLKEIPGWQESKEKNDQEMIDEATLMDLGHLKNSELETKFEKIQRTSCTSWRRCERWLLLVCSVYRARIFRVTHDRAAHDRRQVSDCHFQTSRMHRTSSWCTIGLHPRKNGRRAKVVGITNVRTSSDLDPSAQNPPSKIMGHFSRSRGASRKKRVRTPLSRIAVGRTIWESLDRKRPGKVPNWEC